MNERLQSLLDHLCAAIDPARLAETDERHRRALSWEPVDRPPLVVTHPPDADGPSVEPPRPAAAPGAQVPPRVATGRQAFAHQHGTAIRGNVLLRNDSVIMLSEEMYREQIAPHDARVLQALGGGGIHCCGNVERVFPAFLDVPGVRCFDFGQSELNDVDALYRLAAERRVPLVRVAVTEEELLTDRARERFPTGVSFIHRAASRAAAARVAAAYRSQ